MYNVPKVISDFHSPDTFFLSNFYEGYIIPFEGDEYLSSEAAFQAAKTLDSSLRKPFTRMSASESKKAGRQLLLRSDWESVKDSVMEEILKVKFGSLHPYLQKKLLDTKEFYLIEGNLWHDNYWGFCYCEKCKSVAHKNQLGVALMKVRSYYE